MYACWTSYILEKLKGITPQGARGAGCKQASAPTPPDETTKPNFRKQIHCDGGGRVKARPNDQMKMQIEMASSFADLHAAIAARKTDNKRGAPERDNHPSRPKQIIAEGLGQYSVLHDAAVSLPSRKAPVPSQVDLGGKPEIAVLQLQPAGRGRHGQRHVRLASPLGSASGSYAD